LCIDNFHFCFIDRDAIGIVSLDQRNLRVMSFPSHSLRTGADQGQFRLRCLQQLLPKKLAHGLSTRCAVASHIATCAQQTTPQELTDTIKAAQLTEAELQAVQAALPDAFRPYFQGGTYDACPPVQVVVGRGLVEQTPKGWVLIQRGRRELICSKSWRVRHTVLTGAAKPHCVIEIFENGRWLAAEVN
jgi:hypothetical protein